MSKPTPPLPTGVPAVPAWPAATRDTAAPPPAACGGASTPPRICSERLFAQATELLIEHRGMVYRLRQTALGKLILTK
jgi:hemin uptake protein HemP